MYSYICYIDIYQQIHSCCCCSPYANASWLAELQEEAIGRRISIHRDALALDTPILAAVRLQMHQSLLCTLHQNGLIGGLVALQLEVAKCAITNESLLALQHQNGTAKSEEEHEDDELQTQRGRLAYRLIK